MSRDVVFDLGGVVFRWEPLALLQQLFPERVSDEASALRWAGEIFQTFSPEADWALFDLTDTFPAWLAGQRYAVNYYKQPHLLPTILPKYLHYLETTFEAFLQAHAVAETHVVALKGVGSLFGFLKVKEVVDRLAPRVKGRLLVFFPGSYEENNYRLLDGYDGWNYLAVPITADKDT